ncbi:hypothetical protein WSM22_33420 [Cytophagales bacterium WSM2-2]|nr:hypothetical protein WSM22_33420 [Cytophagales bacterium WSM2-2]
MWVRILLLLWFTGLSKTFALPPGISFIENKGQWHSSIFYHARTQGVSFDLQPDGFRYTFLDSHRPHAGLNSSGNEVSADKFLVKGHVLTSSFVGHNPSAPVPFGIHSEYYNYFLGEDQSLWRSKARAFDGVIYQSFYQGIDLKIYSDGQNVKYDFIVAANADPNQIQWKYAGAESIEIEGGEIVVKTPLADLIEKTPLVYQWINDQKIFVKAEYRLVDGLVSFNISGTYNSCEPLIIDPLLIFSTYSGSTADNWGSTATPGEHGALYSSGITILGGAGVFPATAGAFQKTYGGIYDVAILKYDSAGSNLLYASYLGGKLSESPHSLVVDKDENLIVLGTTSSSDFPTTTGVIQRKFAGGEKLEQENKREIPIPYENGSDIFIVKISKDGTKLLAGTYLGGSRNDGLNPLASPLVKNYGDQMRGDIITDSQGNIFVSTVTSSPDFPVGNGFNSIYNGGESDALILKLSGDLTKILWGAFLGGNSDDASHTIQIDKTENIFVGGGSASANFPTTSGVYQSVPKGDVDGWIAQIKGDGSALLKSTMTGTSLFNEVYFLDLDKDENVYVFGQTVGAFPVTAGVYSNPNSGQFLQKFDNSLSTLLISTVFGSGIGQPNISPTAFLINDCNNIFMSGWGGLVNSDLSFWNTSTTGMKVTSDAVQKTTSGSDFYFIVLSGDASQLLYATFLGGTSSRTHMDGGTCRFDKNGTVYHAVCSGCAAFNATGHSTSDFPTTKNAWSRVNRSSNCNNAAFKFDLSTLKARIQTNSIHLNQPGLNKFCVSDKVVFQNLSTGGQSYAWSLSDGTKQIKTDTSLVIRQFPNPGTYTVKLKVTDVGTCTGVDSTSTMISVSKPLGQTGPDKAICFNMSTQLDASGGVAYLWTAFDKSFSSTLPSPIVSPTISTSYYIAITDVNGCTVVDTVKVKVVPHINIKFTLEPLFPCDGRPTVKVENLTDPGEDTFFDFGDGIVSDEQTSTHVYNKDGKYNIRLVGKKEFCVYDSSVLVPIYTRFIPNVFTPEQSPEQNDTFMIQYGDQHPAPGSALLTQISIKIYNRWGKLVYESKDYKNDWTANNVDGDSYYYEVTVLGETTCKGWVQVIK